MNKQFKKISVNILIFLLKILIILKRLAAAFFISLIYKPGRVFARFIFYKILVKLYKFYIWSAKKLGLSKFNQDNIIYPFASQRLTHIAVIVLTIFFVLINVASKTKADSSADNSSQTILASLIKSEFDTPEEGQLVEEFFDEEAFISSTQQSYLESLSAVRVEPMAQPDLSGDSEFGDTGSINGMGVLVKPNIAETLKVKRSRTETINYTVKIGDTVSTIAAEFGVSVSTILWENNLSAYSLIRPGDSLSILPVSGISHKVARGENLALIANKYSVEKESIIEINKLSESGILAAGQNLIIPGGSKSAYATPQTKAYSGFKIIKDLVKSAPDDDSPKPSSAKPIAGNKMNWPTEGYRITQYYSWRHHGLDIANKIGTPLYAADSGIIEYAGWGKGYGNQIVIDHGGGKKTRYAHQSKFYVKKGDFVNKGQIIGAMGSTGWSTGSHLHFEVIINGIKYNPLSYIK